VTHLDGVQFEESDVTMPQSRLWFDR